jgi:hypothetical protein
MAMSADMKHRAEQRMIESLAEHGVLAADLVPALMTTHTVKNPEYDPAAAKVIHEEQEESEEEQEEEEAGLSKGAEKAAISQNPPKAPNLRAELSGSDPFGQLEDREEAPPPPYEAPKPSRKKSSKSVNPFGDDSDLDEGDIGSPSVPSEKVERPRPSKTEPNYPEIEEGDIANTLEDLVLGNNKPDEPPSARIPGESVAIPEDRTQSTPAVSASKPTNAAEVVERGIREEGPKQSEALPGVSTALSKTDENVTLDIRWTVVSHMMRVTKKTQ